MSRAFEKCPELLLKTPGEPGNSKNQSGPFFFKHPVDKLDQNNQPYEPKKKSTN
jgi:hypothetical protein